MIIQSSTLIMIGFSFFMLIFAFFKNSEFIAKAICLFGAGLCCRFGWLQFKWFERSIGETMTKTVEWNTHDLVVSSFFFLLALYFATGVKNEASI